MTPTPEISVILPTYNRAKRIGQTIDSILGQTYRNFELIIVDDGGTDETPHLVASYRDPRIQYFTIPHAGQSAAKNFGLTKANGSMIAFCDDDDVWMEGKLDEQTQFMKNHPNIDICYCGSFINEHGRDIHYYFLQISGDALVTLLFVNPATTPAYLIKRECFTKVGYFDTSFTAVEDHLLWIKFAKYFKFGGIDKPLVRVYRGEKGVGRDYYQNIVNSNRSVLQELRAILREMPERIPARLEKKIIAYTKFKLAKAKLYAGRKLPAAATSLASLWLNPHNSEAWLLLPSCLLPSRIFASLIPRLQRRGGGRLPHLPKGVNINW